MKSCGMLYAMNEKLIMPSQRIKPLVVGKNSFGRYITLPFHHFYFSGKFGDYFKRNIVWTSIYNDEKELG
jgi:hypothetical protein